MNGFFIRTESGQSLEMIESKEAGAIVLTIYPNYDGTTFSLNYDDAHELAAQIHAITYRIKNPRDVFSLDDEITADDLAKEPK